MLDKFRPAFTRLKSVFSRTKDATFGTIQSTLIMADLGVKYVDAIMEKVGKSKGDPVQVLREELVNLLSLPIPESAGKGPCVVMISGVNGSGKTTTVAKLANLLRRRGSVLLVSGDTYRDAAREQLEIWAGKVGVEMVSSHRGQDAAAVVYDGVSKALANDIDFVVIDTAGRLHTRLDLMEELKKIVRVVKKFKPGGPDFNILTIDASLGQNSIQQARAFAKAIDANGIVLTKFDGTAKGGAIIPICNELRLPVLYLGVGEGVDDLVEFDPRDFVDTLFSS